MIAALVPAKALDQAKGRLAALISEDERRRLALAMLEDVLRALQAVPCLDLIAAVSPDADVLARARALGAEAIAEPPTVRGINQALAHALAALTERPDALLVVLADVPTASPADITSVVTALPPGRGIALCPSADSGTSALALRPPDVIRFRFGANSFQAHKREAAARGVPARVLRIDSLARDVDGPEDLRHLMSRPAETATHRLLARLGLADRLQIPSRA
ncbi:MAG: 2-phospho-L-lactate guanylyltransferase [Chloroflexi bacterium]|nr:2-phospho-L-lactate guanylyltransferase [Chloroflexota bacterium]